MPTPKKFDSRTSAQNIVSAYSSAGKNIIVTGANAGIGFATAKALTGGGANVIFACRNLEKGQQAIETTKTEYPDSSPILKQLDLASFESIRAFAADIDWDCIDVLICNAGLISKDYQETTDGIEQTVGICHFGHFMLFKELKDKLQKSSDGRLVMVSSESHRWPAKLDIDNFPLSKKKYGQMRAYGQAKLANILFATEVQRRFGNSGITACALHPGALVTTSIGSDSALTALAMKLVSPFTKNPDQGAATSVLCALHPDSSYIAGSYFSHCQKKAPTKEAQSADKAQKLWGMSEIVCRD